VSGSNYSSKVNIIRKGISIKEHVTLNALPPVFAEGGLNCIGDKLLLRVVGLPQMVLA